MEKYEKVLGCLALACYGDALGAASEMMSREMIYKRFNGPISKIEPIPADGIAAGFPLGSVTDDFSLCYYTIKAILENNWQINDETANKALVEWSNSKYYSLAGPTTISAINKLKGLPPLFKARPLPLENSKGTNGGAMKIGPIALFAKNDYAKLQKDVVTLLKPTHYNSTAIASALAVSYATLAALQDNCDTEDIIKAASLGALEGENYEPKLANPSVYKRIQLAVAIGKRYGDDYHKACLEIADIIGTGINGYESIPAAIGIIVACKADSRKALIEAANIGNDTDTIATMVGAILGAKNGLEGISESDIDLLNKANNFDLRELANQIMEYM